MLQHSWRWFGPGDPVSLKDISQTGARSVVTALHHIPVGETWEIPMIRERQALIREAGLEWSVVESVPVHEDIKTRTGNYQAYIENYKQTIRNLGECKVPVLCYNFMPVLDWSRTDLNFKFSDGSESLYFDSTLFAVIDMYILKRSGAEESYPEDVLSRAKEICQKIDASRLADLERTFLLGLPGSGETFTLEQVRQRIDRYRNINRETFKSNLQAFVREIAPVAESSGVRLAIHPDDPPWTLMGLPKAVSTLEDAKDIIDAYPSPFNGITMCTGSFGASTENDIPHMAEVLAERINFAHLRNVTRDSDRNFHEQPLFEGDIDMASVMKTLVLENRKRKAEDPGYPGIPIRPDHGQRILGDVNINTYPGYALYGRMKSLAEIRGLELGIISSHFQ